MNHCTYRSRPSGLSSESMMRACGVKRSPSLYPRNSSGVGTAVWACVDAAKRRTNRQRESRLIMIFQVISIVGAILVLAAFAAQQFKRIDAETKTYQILNLIGGFCLTVTAVVTRQYGFILLEGSWTVVRAWGVWR